MKRICRLVVFLLGLIPLLILSNFFFTKADTQVAVMMHEMHNRSDIELAIIGSSIVHDNFNPEIISEITGLTAFDIGVDNASLPANIALTEDMYRTNSPEWVVLVQEPFTLTTAREFTETQYRMLFTLPTWSQRIRYFSSAYATDHDWLNRLFMFREFGISSFDDFIKTVRIRTNFEKYGYAYLAELPDDVTYCGRGFIRHTPENNADHLIRQDLFSEDFYTYYDLIDQTKELLLAYRDLVTSHGSKLLIVMYPNLTGQVLRGPHYLSASQVMMNFCKENDIPCYNFDIAKDDFLPPLDHYFYDAFHMNGEGADIFSEIFADFFNRYRAGEDVSALFYPSCYAYLYNIDFISNTWLRPDEETGILYASCNTGSDVEPEYRFVLRAQDGSETLLRDYCAQNDYPIPVLSSGENIRVYARPVGGEQDPYVYYDYPDDRTAFYDRYGHWPEMVE